MIDLRPISFTAGLAGILMVTMQQPSLAGGTSWLVTVEEFENLSATRATVILQTTEIGDIPRSFYTECSRVSVDLNYLPEPLWDRTWSKKWTFKEHRVALSTLKIAHQQGAEIRFGALGIGLKPRPRDSWGRSIMDWIMAFVIEAIPSAQKLEIPSQCQLESRGIAVLQEHTGDFAVYSFHGRV